MKNKHLHSKRMFYSVLFILLLNVVGMTKMYASYDFSAVCETGQTLYYTITDAENHYVKLTYPGTDFNNGWYGFTKPVGDMVLPENVQYDGLTYSVTSIGDHVFSYCSGLTSIEIPGSVTSIGSSAFGSCSGLTSIEIPNSVTSIGIMAFNRCSGLTSIEIPNSVASIGNSAFFKCSSLTSIEIPNSVTSISSYVFEDCSSLTSIEIPNTVTSIGDYAFAYCSGLTTIEIPNSVTSIGGSAFYGCVHLTSIEIPTSLTIIENSTFSNCRGLTSVEIPNSVTSIGSSAFRGCSGLTSLTFGNSVTSIGDDAFEICYGLVYYTGNIHQWCNIQFGNSSSNPLCYAHNLFIDNELVTDLVIPETVTEIKPYAFYGATCLTSLTISNSVTSIGNSAFYNCSGLTTIEIPNSVISIGNSVFSGCSGLTTIEIPSSVTSIDNYAFYNCSGLTEVHYLGDVVEWCNIQFGDSYSNPLNYAHNLFINNALVTDLVIPETITEIKPYAFYGATCLATLTISNSVTSIDSHAFSGCSGLASLTIPDSVTSIGEYAFSGCSGLTSLTFGNSVTSIGRYAFNNCHNIFCITSFAETPPSLDNTSSFSTFYNVSKAIPFCVPCGSEDEYASLSWGGFSNFYGMCGGTVTVTSNPEEGMVIGGGTFEAGQTCTVTATAMEGYVFAKWTLNGMMISNHSECTFYVLGEMTLMAHFVPNGNIVFTDSNVKSICVSNWDINGDDELSYSEAASVLSLEHCFTSNSEITSFDELQYFIGLISIGRSAFNGCSELTSIVLPNSITSIDGYAFQNCSGLTGNLTIPNSVTSIGSSAFRGCSGFTGNLTIGNSVTSIDYYAFLGCTSFTGNLTLGSSVTSIGHEAFYDCSGFTSMTVLADNPPTLSYNVFDYVNKRIPVSVPCGSVDAYTMLHWGSFNNIFGLCGGTVTVVANPEEGGMVTGGGIIGADESCTVTATANEGYAFANWTRDGIRVSSDAEYTFYVREDMCLVAQFVPNSNITFADANVKALCVAHWDSNSDGELSYDEAASVTDLGTVFKSNSNIVNFNELRYFTSLSSIGSQAFYNCYALTSIAIPSTIISIGDEAFWYCINLTSMTVLAETPPTLGSNVFLNVNKSIPVYVPCASSEDYQNAALWNEFTNYIGMCGYYITATTNPTDGGSVTGAGTYIGGETCTLTATANIGYAFDNWTKDGTMVSTEATYSFTVTESATYEAHFIEIQVIHFITAGNWSEASNWQGGALPGIHDEVFIDAPCQLDMNANMGALTVSDGQSLTLQSGMTLNVKNTLTNTATTGLIIEDGAQLIHASEDVSAMVKKNIVGHGTDYGKYYLISNPLTSIVDPDQTSIYHLTEGNYDFYDWLASAPDHLEWRNYKTNGFTMSPEGYGYLYANENSVELNFPGTLRPSDNRYAKSVSYDSNNTEHPGWNLIGNPFVCNAYLVNENNEPLPFFRMNATGDGFEAVTPGTAIAPVEGVFYQASGNGTVYFIRTQPQVTTGALNGKFTINEDGGQVYFSQGNLQYQASTDTWKFAENQYDYVGEDNNNISSTYNGWIDLFGWGTSGYNHGANCYQPWSISRFYDNYYAYSDSYYNLNDQTGQADWGYNPISNGCNQPNQWRTLTNYEWWFLLYQRTTTSGIRHVKARVNGVNGVILLPDDWSTDIYSLSNTNNNEASFNSNVISASQWTMLENAGAVFLPAAGNRDGASLYNVGSSGNYWSASNYYGSGSACCMGFNVSYLYTSQNYRYCGLSVRLVCPAE